MTAYTPTTWTEIQLKALKEELSDLGYSSRVSKEIVRAVNCHEELLQTAKDMLANMDAYYEVHPDDPEGDPLRKYRIAIAKAETTSS